MKVKILIFVIVLFAIGGFIFATMGIYSANPSTRIGKLHKLDETGLIFKSFEGELTISNKGATGEPFHFSVNANNKELIKQLNDVIGKEVKLDYKQEYVKMSWTGDTRYFIKYVATKIEELQ